MISDNLEAAAFVLTELSALNGVPQRLRPSLQQWHNLLKACSGALVTTKFECFANQYMVLNDGMNKGDPDDRIGEPHDVAAVLNAIACLSQGEIASINLVGGSVCGWLAAFAHTFFDLDVQLHSGDGHLLLKTNAEHKMVHLNVIFDTSRPLAMQLSSTSYFVGNVKGLFRESYLLRTGRVSWDQVIKRTFGSTGEQLLKSKRSFGIMIGTAARIFAAVTESDEMFFQLLGPQLEEYQNRQNRLDGALNTFQEEWIGYHYENFGRGYVEFTIRRFPELSQLRQFIEPCLSFSASTAVSEYEIAAARLNQMCHCASCLRRLNPSKPDYTGCIYRLGKFIIGLSWKLSNLAIDEAIQPLHIGLWVLWGKEPSEPHEPHENQEYLPKPLNITVAMLSRLTTSSVHYMAQRIFAGTAIRDEDRRDGRLNDLPPAVVVQGLCFFVDTFEKISDRPELGKFLRVLPGTIEGKSGAHFDIIEEENMEFHNEYEDETVSESRDYAELNDRYDTPMQVQILARETLKDITINFQFSSPRGTIYTGPMALKLALLRSVGLICCHCQDCEPLHAPDTSFSLVREGFVYPKEDIEAGRTMVIRRLAGNTIARCLSVCREMQRTGTRRIRSAPLLPPSEDKPPTENICLTESTPPASSAEDPPPPELTAPVEDSSSAENMPPAERILPAKDTMFAEDTPFVGFSPPPSLDTVRHAGGNLSPIRQVREHAVILRRDECIECTIRAGRSLNAHIVYITM